MRHASLCGHDNLSGKSDAPRRKFIRQRMEFFAGIVGIEVLDNAVMNNRLHCVLQSRHDIVATWSANDVAEMVDALPGSEGSALLVVSVYNRRR